MYIVIDFILLNMYIDCCTLFLKTIRSQCHNFKKVNQPLLVSTKIGLQISRHTLACYGLEQCNNSKAASANVR